MLETSVRYFLSTSMGVASPRRVGAPALYLSATRAARAEPARQPNSCIPLPDGETFLKFIASQTSNGPQT